MAHERDTLAEDWVALWQSELAAMAADRELRESWTGLLALWASAAGAAAQFAAGKQGYDFTGPAARAANRTAGPAQPAGTAPAATASDLGGDEARRLYERIAELESRLSTFERRRGGKPVRPGDPKTGV